jgi:hypothetical protein
MAAGKDIQPALLPNAQLCTSLSAPHKRSAEKVAAQFEIQPSYVIILEAALTPVRLKTGFARGGRY